MLIISLGIFVFLVCDASVCKDVILIIYIYIVQIVDIKNKFIKQETTQDFSSFMNIFLQCIEWYHFQQ